MMASVSVDSLEELVLRVLYEGAVSARECAAELSPYARPSGVRLAEIRSLLHELTQRAYLDVHYRGRELRYSLTAAGSRRLAELVD
jgi:hypothetical protein